MIQSMTGYAVANRELPFGVVQLELRSVNHRYLDLQLRLPEDLRGLEPMLRERLAGKFSRGKVECRVGINSKGASAQVLRPDAALVARLADAARTIATAVPDARPLSVADFLRWPGVLADAAYPVEQLAAACGALLDQVASEFSAARAREGEKLKTVLLERSTRIEALVAETAPRVPQLVAAYRDKLAAKLAEAGASPDDDRLRQEVVLFAAKVDVDEELSRLGAHLKEVRRILQAGGACGKRLDFLMQELNREANTLGSKSAEVEVTRAAVEIKVLIEQMREQVQNIE